MSTVSQDHRPSYRTCSLFRGTRRSDSVFCTFATIGSGARAAKVERDGIFWMWKRRKRLPRGGRRKRDYYVLFVSPCKENLFVEETNLRSIKRSPSFSATLSHLSASWPRLETRRFWASMRSSPCLRSETRNWLPAHVIPARLSQFGTRRRHLRKSKNHRSVRRSTCACRKWKYKSRWMDSLVIHRYQQASAIVIFCSPAGKAADINNIGNEKVTSHIIRPSR